MLSLLQSDFAYSRSMQIILAYMTFCFTFLCHYMTSGLVLGLYGDTASRRDRMFFSFFTGTILNDAWTYGIYLLGGMVSFSPVVYAMVTVPNPLIALLYYYIGSKTLHLSPSRSIRLMCHTYLYFVTYKSIVFLVNYLFFKQPNIMHYNYMIDACSLLVDTVLVIIISYLAGFFIRKKKLVIDMRDAISVKSVPMELARCFMLSVLAYSILVFSRTVEEVGKTSSYTLAAICLVLLLLLNLLWDVYKAADTKRQNKAAYVSTLVKSMDDFRAFRHDFKNILQTYGGYIALNDIDKLRQYHETVVNTSQNTEAHLELAEKMEQCPVIVSLLIEKLTYAQKSGVDFQLQINTAIEFSDSDLLDASRCLGCLIDNAIEAAALSDRKMAVLSWDEKKNGNRLFVLTNSTRDEIDPMLCYEKGFTTKQAHSGLGLSTVRNIIDAHATCSLNATCYHNEFSVYIEILENHEPTRRHENHIGNFIQEFSAPPLLSGAVPSKGMPLDFSALTLLIADDNPFLLESIRSYLESLRCTVDSAEDGTTAIALFQQNPGKYDLILLDVEMPGMDGMETARRIRANGSLASLNIPMIAVTGSMLPNQRKLPLFDATLQKPFALDEIQTLIERVLTSEREQALTV